MGQVDCIEGVRFFSKKIIPVELGNVMHIIKSSNEGFAGFGEAYFSWINPKTIKSWRLHREATSHLTVPLGEVRLVFYDDRKGSDTKGSFMVITLSKNSYGTVQVCPGVWMAIQNSSAEPALILNISSLEHDFQESDKKALQEIPFLWNL